MPLHDPSLFQIPSGTLPHPRPINHSISAINRPLMLHSRHFIHMPLSQQHSRTLQQIEIRPSDIRQIARLDDGVAADQVPAGQYRGDTTLFRVVCRGDDIEDVLRPGGVGVAGRVDAELDSTRKELDRVCCGVEDGQRVSISV